MRTAERTRTIKVQTNRLPTELSPAQIGETARGIALYYKNGAFTYQTFFTPPICGEINWIEGLETNADVHFRSVSSIGPGLLHLRLIGQENNIRQMCDKPDLYKLLNAINSTFTTDVRSRRYLDTTKGAETWNVLISLDKEKAYIANHVLLGGKKTRITNIIVLGDTLFALTDAKQAVSGALTPEIFEVADYTLKVEPMESINRLGKIDLLTQVPNSEDTFMVTSGSTMYLFNIRGEMLEFNSLERDVKQINSVNFNSSRAIMATTKGLYEIDVQEIPNMVKPRGLPRQIINPQLKENFNVALYVEDPHILGVHPQVGVLAKNKDNKVLFF